MKGRLLVVDDEVEIRELVSRHFRHLGYQVLCAGNGRAALEVLEAERIDVVLSDIMMPDMNGIELLERLRQEYPMVRVVMMTGYVTQENLLACFRMGAETCVFKPLQDLQELETAIDRAFDHVNQWRKILARLHSLTPASAAS